jgi:rfaE bifunctional protein kinase chain/domain
MNYLDNLDSIFSDFNGKRVVIVGDIMVDKYVIGKVERVSPEAPVPVVDVSHLDSRLGGAGNVALNIKAMGGIPILCSVIGQDVEGDDLLNLLDAQGLYSKAILRSDKRKTTTKTRVIGNNHQLLRFDHEVKTDIDSLDSYLLQENYTREIENCDVIIFEDYNKGVLHSNNIASLIQLANGLNIPTIVDPKKNNFLDYKNVTLFKPNLKEIKEGLNWSSDLSTIEDIQNAINVLQKQLNNEITMVTLSERGVVIATNNEWVSVPAHIRNIADVSGAGDTVVSVAALCLASKLDLKLIAELSNLSGGLVCEKLGVVPIEKEHLLSEAKRVLAQ